MIINQRKTEKNKGSNIVPLLNLKVISVYEKWLRRRLDYATIRETGNHAAPGFIHTIVHSGGSPNAVACEIREEMWKNNKYPNSKFFQHGQVCYRYPRIVKELVDLRFAHDPIEKLRSTPNQTMKEHSAYHLTFPETALVPNWLAPLVINDCPQPHSLETPMSWPMDAGAPPPAHSRCPDPSRVNVPKYPMCCHRTDNVCAAVYCKTPIPEAVFYPGPTARGDTLIRWHVDPYRGSPKTKATQKVNHCEC